MRKSQCRVIYSPTTSNRIVLRKLLEAEALDGMEVVPLEASKEARIRQLQKLHGTYAYVWGDGGMHDESRATDTAEIKAKIGVDAHPDDGRGIELTCGTHVWHTAQAGIITMTMVDTSEKVESAIEFGLQFGPHEISVTVDCDALNAFPAMPLWINNYGIGIGDVLELLRALGPRVLRLDVGGLVSGIPDFNLVGRLDNGIVKPSIVETIRVADSCTAGLRVDSETVNRVLTYGTKAYADIIQGFFRHCMQP